MGETTGELPLGGAHGASRRLGRFHLVSVLVLILLLLLAGGAALLTNSVVRGQEGRLLTERANELKLVLTESVTNVENQMATLVLLVDRYGPTAFDQQARADLAGTPNTSWDLLFPAGGGRYSVVDAVGSPPAQGEILTGPAAAAAAAAPTKTIVSSPVFGSGAQRSVAFAQRGTGPFVVLHEVVVGEPKPPRAAGTSPFSEVRVALYAADHPDPSQVLIATTTALPMKGTVRREPMTAGVTTWLVAVKAERPLVGSLTEAAPLLALLVGIAGSILVFIVIEVILRRRDSALEAMRVEHRFAETLQRRLLGSVPELESLDVATSYVPSADHQQVGGDWFDVFDLGGRGVALVIGDVMGHDVEAAATMAQLRAALRSYAAEGGDPAWTVERLSRFIDLYGIPSVVTLVFGILEPPEGDGSRRFHWCNAGHLPPLLRHTDGTVLELGEGTSPLLGAPSTAIRPLSHVRVEPGAALLMYTDGLVEMHDEVLTESVDRLADLFAGFQGATAAEMRDSILDRHRRGPQRDDVALMIVRNVSAAGLMAAHPGLGASPAHAGPPA